jgi:hypothetical protein
MATAKQMTKEANESIRNAQRLIHDAINANMDINGNTDPKLFAALGALEMARSNTTLWIPTD